MIFLGSFLPAPNFVPFTQLPRCAQETPEATPAMVPEQVQEEKKALAPGMPVPSQAPHGEVTRWQNNFFHIQVRINMIDFKNHIQ